MRVGGDRFDDAIIAYVRRTQGSLIGTQLQANKAGKGSVSEDVVKEIDVRGRNLAEAFREGFC